MNDDELAARLDAWGLAPRALSHSEKVAVQVTSERLRRARLEWEPVGVWMRDAPGGRVTVFIRSDGYEWERLGTKLPLIRALEGLYVTLCERY